MPNYISLGPNYQWHFATEEDRSWLEEALTNHQYANASMAIAMNENLNENNDRFKFSRIASDKSGNRILWVSQRVMRSKNSLTILAIAIHPNYRNQDYIRQIAVEEFAWLKNENRWNVSTLEFSTGIDYITGKNLFNWSDIKHSGSTTSRIPVADL
jgi:hypothetical protein